MSQKNEILVFDQERIDNIVFNSFVATNIDYVGTEICVTYADNGIHDPFRTTYKLPLLKLTPKQIHTLLLRRKPKKQKNG